MKQWYTLHTKANSEYQVAMVLEALGVETYVPEVTVTDKRYGQQTKPFFPNYLFAKIDFEYIALSLVRWTPGLRRIVSVDGIPVSIPNDVIAIISQNLDKYQMTVSTYAHTFQSGEPVRIVSGPFQDMLAIFDRRSSSETRVQVLLNVLGRVNKLCIGIDDIQKVPHVDNTPKEKRPRRTRGRGRFIKKYAES